MADTAGASRVSLSDLRRVLEANPAVDWRAVSLAGSEWPGATVLCDVPRGALRPLLQAYQRLLRFLPTPEESRALPLLEGGFHSAIQIAGLSRDEFVRRWCALFPGEEEAGLAVHQAALRRRSDLLHHYIHDVQQSEPHYRAARFR